MNLLETTQDFITFNLAPFISKKELDVLIHRVSPNETELEIANQTENDKAALEPWVNSLRHCIEVLKRHKKTKLDGLRKTGNKVTQQYLSPSARQYLKLSKLEADELLLLLAQSRYQIDLEKLSLILEKPAASLEFQLEQIKRFNKISPIEGSTSESTADKNALASLDIHSIAAEVHQLIEGTQDSSIASFFSEVKWKSLPSPVRFLLELTSGFLVFGILLWSIPKIRSSYELSLQKRVNEYLVDHGISEAPTPAGMTKPTIIQEVAESNTDTTLTSAEPEELAKPTTAKKQPKVVEGETWRFSFTGAVAASETEQSASDLIEKIIGVAAKSSVVPGGTQIEFTAPTGKIIALKTAFEELTFRLQKKYGGNTNPAQNALLPGSVNMSWYKKNMGASKKIPRGNVQVIVWISSL